MACAKHNLRWCVRRTAHAGTDLDLFKLGYDLVLFDLVLLKKFIVKTCIFISGNELKHEQFRQLTIFFCRVLSCTAHRGWSCRRRRAQKG